MEKIDLQSFFPPVGAKQWKQQIQYELHGEDFNKNLVWESPEGIRVKPFYTREDLDGALVGLRHRVPGWLPGYSVPMSVPSKANRLALKAIENGVSVLEFHLRKDDVPMGRLLDGIDLEKTEVHCHFEFLSEAYIGDFLNALPQNTKGIFLHLDAIGHLVRTGNWYENRAADLKTMGELLQQCTSRKNVVPLGVDGCIYHNAGANIVQQLAYALAHGREYLHHFGDTYSPPMALKFATGANYFFEIAKLRAFRILWETLADAYCVSPACHVMATPGLRNKTLYDYNCNMFRTTTECMAAILGGADTVVNQSYDRLFQEPNDFGERMAINQLLILKEEARFGDVSNPADGSYLLESLTCQLAEKALALFKQVEAGGGFLRQLKEHKIQNKVRESAEKEQNLFDAGELILVGSNAFQNDSEKLEGSLRKTPDRRGENRKTLIEPLLLKRLAANMERNMPGDE